MAVPVSEIIPRSERVEKWPQLYERPHDDDQDEFLLDVTFLRFSDDDSGKVHVFGRYSPFGESLGADTGETGWLMASQQALCGARGRPGGLHGITAFADTDLCRRCHKAFPHNTDLLFEHPTSDDDADAAGIW